jgi:hypothetical protein
MFVIGNVVILMRKRIYRQISSGFITSGSTSPERSVSHRTLAAKQKIRIIWKKKKT